ncbi:MAG: hypothetical protein KJ698_04835 [Actinobacteria bacterium]|nr:hypothetical protein [Actinomycetota bacterium]MBU1493088.1 hypothetical protein [Actinomycetota bacterium]
MRRTVSILLTALVLAGCGDVLEGVGDLSSDFVRGGSSTTVTTVPDTGPDLGLSSITGINWVNDDLDLTASGSREVLLRDVWQRGDGTSYVQAGAREIAMALPGVQVPTLVPVPITYITSQLVFDEQTALLEAGTSAAFGYWSTEPYVLPRSEAQLMVLRVGLATSDEAAEFSDISVFNVEGGRELAWVEGDYVYQLFCRTGVIEEACITVAGSFQPLTLLTLVRPATGDETG